MSSARDRRQRDTEGHSDWVEGLVLDPAQVVTAVLKIIHDVSARETICLPAFLSSLSVLQEAEPRLGWGESQ